MVQYLLENTGYFCQKWTSSLEYILWSTTCVYQNDTPKVFRNNNLTYFVSAGNLSSMLNGHSAAYVRVTLHQAMGGTLDLRHPSSAPPSILDHRAAGRPCESSGVSKWLVCHAHGYQPHYIDSYAGDCTATDFNIFEVGKIWQPG